MNLTGTSSWQLRAVANWEEGATTERLTKLTLSNSETFDISAAAAGEEEPIKGAAHHLV